MGTPVSVLLIKASPSPLHPEGPELPPHVGSTQVGSAWPLASQLCLRCSSARRPASLSQLSALPGSDILLSHKRILEYIRYFPSFSLTSSFEICPQAVVVKRVGGRRPKGGKENILGVENLLADFPSWVWRGRVPPVKWWGHQDATSWNRLSL